MSIVKLYDKNDEELLSFTELHDDILYNKLNEYKYVQLDYARLYSAYEYCGVESHQKAVISAMKQVNKRGNEQYSIHFPVIMTAEKLEFAAFVSTPEKTYINSYGIERPNTETVSKPIKYWYAFLCPANGTPPYSVKDFKRFNNYIFSPQSKFEVFSWCDNWSDYFDRGKEWWGTGCWSIYEFSTQTYTVIFASTTD